MADATNGSRDDKLADYLLLDEEEEDEVGDDDGDLSEVGVDFKNVLRTGQAEIDLTAQSTGENEKPAPSSIRQELKNIFNALTRSEDAVDAGGDANSVLRDNFEEYRRHMEDITPNRDGGVFKRILRPGTGASAGNGNIVKFHYWLQIEDQDEPFDSTFSRGKLQKAKLGAGTLISGLELGLCTMHEGELSDFLITSQYAFGPMGSPPLVPPNCTIRATVRLMECIEEDPVDAMSVEERRKLLMSESMAYIERKVENGKKEFGRGKMVAAINRYKDAQKQCQIMLPIGSEMENTQIKDVLIRVHKNLAVCYLKVPLMRKVKRHLKKLGELGVSDGKVHYMWGKVYYNEGEYDKALEELRLAQMSTPGNTEIAKLVSEIHQKKSEYDTKSKEQIKRMFTEVYAKNLVNDSA